MKGREGRGGGGGGGGRDAQPDPNSPFAKLAALKAQLEFEQGIVTHDPDPPPSTRATAGKIMRHSESCAV